MSPTACIGWVRGAALGEVDIAIVSSLEEARKARHAQPGRPLLVAGASLPFGDGTLGAVEDRRARSYSEVEEDARVLEAGGRLRVIADSRGGPRFWRRRSPSILASDWSAWFLAAGFADLTQRQLEHAVATEGVIRKIGDTHPVANLLES